MMAARRACVNTGASPGPPGRTGTGAPEEVACLAASVGTKASCCRRHAAGSSASPHRKGCGTQCPPGTPLGALPGSCRTRWSSVESAQMGDEHGGISGVCANCTHLIGQTQVCVPEQEHPNGDQRGQRQTEAISAYTGSMENVSL